MRKQRVFIGTYRSYEALTKIIYDYLTQKGIDVYYHFSQNINSEFDKNIKPQQLSCDCLIIPVTASSLQVYGYTNHYRLMVETALKEQQVIIPLMYPNASWDTSLIEKYLPADWYSLPDYAPILIDVDNLQTTLHQLETRILTTAPTHTQTQPKAIFPLSIIKLVDAKTQAQVEWHSVQAERVSLQNGHDELPQPLASQLSLLPIYYGNGRQKTEAYKNAIQRVRIVIQNDPQNSFAHYVFGQIYIELRNYKKAIEHLSECIQLGYPTGGAYLMRAELLEKMGFPESALSDVESAIRMQPDNREYLYKRAEIYQKRNQIVQALQEYKKLLEIAPSIHVLLQLATIQMTLSQYDAAMRYINQALDIDPNHIRAYSLRASIYATNEQYDLALEDYQRIMGLGGASYDIYINRSIAYSNLKQYKQAQEDLTSAILTDRYRDDAYFYRATILSDMGQYRQAIRDMSKAIDLASHEPIYYAYRAQLYMTIRKYRKASLDFEKVMQLDPKNKSASENYNKAVALMLPSSLEVGGLFDILNPFSDKSD